MAFLQLIGISKNFNGTVAVDDLNLEVERGDFLVLLGPSGCGKTTTLRMIAGLEIQTEGRIILDGVDISDTPPERRDMAMVFQHLALYPHMSVFDNIAFYLKNIRTPKEQIEARVRRAAQRVQIEPLLHRWPNQISGGQQQRVALAKALVRSPKAFLLDEPLASLDAKLRTSMRTEFKLLYQSLVEETGGELGTFIYVTHDQVEALTLGTRVAVMNDGKLMQIATPSDLYHKPNSLFTATFVGSPEMNLVHGTLQRKGDVAEFGFNSYGINTGVQGREALGRIGQETAPVVLGVRPEAVRIAATGTAGSFQAQVLTIELLGQNNLVTLRMTDEFSLTSLTDTDLPLNPGDTVNLSLQPGAQHFFAPDTGQRL